MCSAKSLSTEAAEGAWRSGTGIQGLGINPMLSLSHLPFQLASGLLPSTCITFASVKSSIHSFIHSLGTYSGSAVIVGNRVFLYQGAHSLVGEKQTCKYTQDSMMRLINAKSRYK